MNGATAQGQGRIAARPPIRGGAPADGCVVGAAGHGGGGAAVASSSTRRGPRSRTRTTSPSRTSRRSTRRAWPRACAARFGACRSIRLPMVGMLSPAFLILIFPLGFRLTCYYYRKAYYRSFWLAAAGLRGAGRASALHAVRRASR